jgi:hypothetical protein
MGVISESFSHTSRLAFQCRLFQVSTNSTLLLSSDLKDNAQLNLDFGRLMFCIINAGNLSGKITAPSFTHPRGQKLGNNRELD